MEQTLLEKVKIRLRQFTVEQTETSQGIEANIIFNHIEENPLLLQLINDAKQDAIQYRKYPSHFTDEMITDDIRKNLENVILKLVLYDYNKEGAEFETSNNEGGESRTYVKRESILNDITPFVSSF